MDKLKEQRIRELISLLNNYIITYEQGHPQISDEEWDKLYFELVTLEEETGKYYSNSPTQRIYYPSFVDGLEKVEHNHPMLSLDKTKDINVINSFVGNKSCLFMAKMDGLTCSLRYLNGKLISAETRGNGYIGENVTHNANVISSIPKHISYKDELIIDGEIICTYHDFDYFKETYANPRNFASGSIRLLDSKECLNRNLTFVAWNVIKGFDNYNSLAQKLNYIEDYGFITVPGLLNNSDDVTNEELINEIKDISQQAYGFPIDGVVIKYDDVKYYKSLGATEHHEKGGIAFKFYDEEYETQLLDIEWSMSRTGTLTPVAIFETIDTGNSEISKASLHNLNVLEDTLGLPYPGQKIKVAKMNEIIPQIVWADKESNKDFHTPSLLRRTNCPICRAKLEEKVSSEGTKTLVCSNEQCEGKIINIIDHFCSREHGLDVKGLSKATIGKLLEFGWINKRADIFELYNKQKEWENLSGFGAKSVQNILDAIERSKCTNLEKYLCSLGIPLIGRTVSKEVAKIFSDYNDFRKAIKEGYDFSQIPGFGYEINKSLNSYDYTEADEIANKYLIFEIKEKNNAGAAAQKNLSGLNFVITGKLSRRRDDIITDIEKAGGKVLSSVSVKTNYLIANQPENTTKYNKALSLGIEIINEQELQNFLDKSF